MKRFLAVALLILFGVGMISLIVRIGRTHAEGGETAPLLSAERYDPYGTAALKTFLQEGGCRVIPLTRSFSPAKIPDGVMIQTMTIVKEAALNPTGEG